MEGGKCSQICDLACCTREKHPVIMYISCGVISVLGIATRSFTAVRASQQKTNSRTQGESGGNKPQSMSRDWNPHS